MVVDLESLKKGRLYVSREGHPYKVTSVLPDRIRATCGKFLPEGIPVDSPDAIWVSSTTAASRSQSGKVYRCPGKIELDRETGNETIRTAHECTHRPDRMTNVLIDNIPANNSQVCFDGKRYTCTSTKNNISRCRCNSFLPAGESPHSPNAKWYNRKKAKQLNPSMVPYHCPGVLMINDSTGERLITVAHECRPSVSLPRVLGESPIPNSIINAAANDVNETKQAEKRSRVVDEPRRRAKRTAFHDESTITPYDGPSSTMSFAENTTMPPLLSAPLPLDLTNTSMTPFAPSNNTMSFHPSMSTFTAGITPYDGLSMKTSYHDETLFPSSKTIPKIYAFIRMSPGTDNDGLFQKMFIAAGCKYLIKHGVLPEFNTNRDIKFHEGKDVSRYDVYGSEEYQKFVDTITVSTTDDDSIIILISSLDRIGIEEEKINRILEQLLSLRPTIMFISMNEFGVDPWRASNLLASYHKGRTHTTKAICNHMNAGDSFEIPQGIKEEQSRVLTNAKQLKATWAINGLDDYIVTAVRNGEESHPYEAEVSRWIGNMNLTESMDASKIEQAAGSFCLDSTYQGHRQVLIYHRSSPGTEPRYIDGIPEEQLAMCISYLNISDKTSSTNLGGIIMDDQGSRSTNKRPGMIRMIAKILDGGVSDVIIKCSNRIASDEFALFFGSVCKKMNTTIHCAANIGLAYRSVVERDMQRLSSNSSFNQQYIQSRYIAVEVEEDRIHFENIQRINSRLRGRMHNRNMLYHNPDYEEEEVDEGLHNYDDPSDD